MKTPMKISKRFGEFITNSCLMNKFYYPNISSLNYRVKINALYVIYLILLFHTVTKLGKASSMLYICVLRLRPISVVSINFYSILFTFKVDLLLFLFITYSIECVITLSIVNKFKQHGCCVLDEDSRL